jgi:RecA/RadA recombinase
MKRMLKPRPKTLVDEVKETTMEPEEEREYRDIHYLPNPEQTISSGSTLLDLACYGTRKRGGGVPGGMIIEIYGPSSSGKTAILVELATSAQNMGGDIRFDDPEARLDTEYARLYGLNLPKEKYTRSDTVKEMFKGLREWKPKPDVKNAICVSCQDSLAALSTEMEMDDEDKMGMKRAKDFSALLRKTCRMIKGNNWLVACTNQERDSQTGTVTPGGKGIPYYSSLRLRVYPDPRGGKITKVKTKGKAKIEQTIGIRAMCEVKKSSIDVPFRKAPVYIVFQHGIDDIWANLQWYKENTGSTKYLAVDREWQSVEKAIKHIEQNNLEADLRNMVIDLWEEIQAEFQPDRKKKVRF